MYTVNDIIKKVNKEFTGYLMLSGEIHNLSPKTNILQDLTLDSLDHVELVMAIEEEFDINITDAEASHCVTMQDVYKLVAEKLGVKYTYEVGNKQPKEKNMTILKREDLLNTKWDARKWTRDMHHKWSSLLKEEGFNQLPFDHPFYFVDEDEGVTHTANHFYFLDHLFTEKVYSDIFLEESQNTSATTGSGVHAAAGSANDTRKNISAKNLSNKTSSVLDTLRKVCQEHGLYMTLDPHGKVAVTEVSSDVEYEVESEDQFQKLLSALEVLYSYVKH